MLCELSLFVYVFHCCLGGCFGCGYMFVCLVLTACVSVLSFAVCWCFARFVLFGVVVVALRMCCDVSFVLLLLLRLILCCCFLCLGSCLCL